MTDADDQGVGSIGLAAEGNPAVQMVLPLAEMVSWLRKGVGELIRQAGLQLMELLMEEEVREVVGERSRRHHPSYEQPLARSSRRPIAISGSSSSTTGNI